MLGKFEEGYDMVVGARQSGSHAGTHRALANDVFSRLASWMVMQNIEDLTSGFRVVRAAKFRQFLYLLPNGFSYPTTITMSFFRAGYSVAYVPDSYAATYRQEPYPAVARWRAFSVDHHQDRHAVFATKAFSADQRWLLSSPDWATIYYTMSSGRFTNMSALLFIASIFTFLIGIVSEQISALHYRDIEQTDHEER
ncbi:hypothetical protein [Propionivibrio sp.]|uniref:hypothetical protein n=1 Tax=Propionivibrio sp. TaxID=2212460 RepID=UPI0025F5011D|nr:hypothetical protein [Propionivibrio sp.]